MLEAPVAKASFGRKALPLALRPTGFGIGCSDNPSLGDSLDDVVLRSVGPCPMAFIVRDQGSKEVGPRPVVCAAMAVEGTLRVQFGRPWACLEVV